MSGEEDFGFADFSDHAPAAPAQDDSSFSTNSFAFADDAGWADNADFGSFGGEVNSTSATGDFDAFGDQPTNEDSLSSMPSVHTTPAAPSVDQTEEPSDDFFGGASSEWSSSMQAQEQEDSFDAFNPSTAPSANPPETSTATSDDEDDFDFGKPSSRAVTEEEEDEPVDYGSGNDAFGSFGATPSSAAQPSDMEQDFEWPGDSTSSGSKGADAFADFGGFGDSTASTSAGAPTSSGDAFADFGAAPSAADKDASDAFGDFGNFGQGAPSSSSTADFGDFGEMGSFSSATSSKPQASSNGTGDWGASFDEGPSPSSGGLQGNVTPTSRLGKIVTDTATLRGDALVQRVTELLMEAFDGLTLSQLPSSQASSVPLDELSQTQSKKQCNGRECEGCSTIQMRFSHRCLSCGRNLQLHEKQKLWSEAKTSKQRFLKAQRLPHIETSHLHPLQPTAPGESLPTSDIAVTFDPFANDVQAPTTDPLAPTPAAGFTANFPPSSSGPALTDFDLNLFGEVQAPAGSPQSKKKKEERSDFDNFLLGFDTATPLGEVSTSHSMNAINEAIAKSSKREGKKEEIDWDSMQSNNKKLIDIINKIPDLTFMSSKTLVVPASKYNFQEALAPPSK